MLEVYSTNTLVAEDSTIPMNNVSLQKGCTAVLASPSTINLNKCGIYCISCDCSAEPTEAGLMSIQMMKNSALQPQAQSSVTGEADTISTMGFETLVQVAENNSCCPCSSPTSIQFVNTGVEATFSNFNVVVTKLV